MAQSWSLSVLGWVPGIIMMVVLRSVLDHLDIKDLRHFGYYAFGKSRIGYKRSCLNILLIGFHIFASVKIMNSLSDCPIYTVAFSAIAMIKDIAMSLPKALKHVSFMSMFSALFMPLAILLSMIFAGMEDAAYIPVETYAFPPTGTTFVLTTNTALNIMFLKLPKALAILSAISNLLFIIPPAISFRYLGQHSTAPASPSLSDTPYNKSSFGFVVVPTLVIGGIYANVSAKWGARAAVLATIQITAFVFSEVIPSMRDFLSLLGAAFDSFFHFIFFAVAY
ncbi:transmembrane amino acid transporter [Colletotrichum gloeosporioides Cg-14]|uniref:Transmembrane amino acid transporter n=1 Tax=Colletotrichum gloeosporioides (strain Cg-14) TaxID=1237896 RepID=T0L757_COLGC|nr:transmembrane amino acid transporter [Colletotrichum gloeosporioides Cg-14]